MKTFILVFLIAALLTSAGLLRAEDWKTIDGKVYSEIKIIKIDPDAVTILCRDGGALIPLIMLPDALQKKFHYNAEAAKAAADARDKAELENARSLRAEYRQIQSDKVGSAPTEPAPDTAPDPVVANNSPHHSMAEMAADSHPLDYDADANHYAINNAAAPGPISRTSDDANHHSTSSLFGSGDPLGK